MLALTRHAETGYLREVLRAGASGYVLKHSPSADVLTAIRLVAAGGTFLDQALTRRVLGAFSTESGGLEAGELSAREREVVRLLAFGYSNKEIAARLGVSVKTVESHKANAMHKLDIHARAGLVRFARIKGWLDREPE